MQNRRDYAGGHEAHALGNNGIDVDSWTRRLRRIEEVRARYSPREHGGTANFDRSVVYGDGREDNVAQVVHSGALDGQNPVRVEAATRQLIDCLTRDRAN